ncbi:MAG: HAD hydrolase family protein [archaeon]
MTKKYNFVLDVDGVLTTGQFLYSPNGKEYKVFGPHDADGLELIKDEVEILFISADKRGYPISEKRVKDMGYPIELVTAAERYEYIEKKYGFENTIFMGDGINDVSLLKACKLGIAPANARVEAKEAADFVTESNAAEGAVCDACIEIKKRFLEEK